MSGPNQVFDVERTFRSVAYRLQLWLAGLGFLSLVAAAVLVALGLAGVWAFSVGGGLIVAFVIWALAWRRRVERAFWRGARVPRRGEAVRLPLEAPDAGAR